MRTTLPEISACADPHAAHDNASARQALKPFIASLPADLSYVYFLVLYRFSVGHGENSLAHEMGKFDWLESTHRLPPKP
jgi:hypothetical protein